ncbi:hypothetical protein AACH06_03520 [Ideonella sp. DXS29W]|uniref:Uncharacterized protein n=1 Tax=Ideonella lacteola TaxID=2984193 RepID=A0ABU9BLS4_9BURK
MHSNDPAPRRPVWWAAGLAVAAVAGIVHRPALAADEGAAAGAMRTTLCAAAKTQQAGWLALWRDEFLRRHGINAAEMAQRVEVQGHEVECGWNSGLAWRVNYTVAYGWARVATHDELVLTLYSSTDEYRHLNLARDRLWLPSEILRAADARVGPAQLQKHDLSAKPAFATEALAQERLVQELGGLKPQRSEFGQLRQHCAKPCTPGHPTLQGHATVDEARNQCRSAELDLLTGQAWVRDDPCRVS